MKNITVFVSENFKFLEEKFSIYLNRRVFVMEYATIFQHLSESRFMPHTLHRIIKGCVCVGGGGGGGPNLPTHGFPSNFARYLHKGLYSNCNQRTESADGGSCLNS